MAPIQVCIILNWFWIEFLKYCNTPWLFCLHGILELIVSISSTKRGKSMQTPIDFALKFAAKINLKSFSEGSLKHPKPQKINPKAVLQHPGAPRGAQRGSGSNQLFNFPLFWTILGSPLGPKSRSKIDPWPQKGRQEAIFHRKLSQNKIVSLLGLIFHQLLVKTRRTKTTHFIKSACNVFNLATP